MGLKYAAIRTAFELLWLSRMPALFNLLSRSRGVIFTLHRVLPDEPADFSPNAILQVQPDFLDFCLERLRDLGLDIVSMDEALERLAAPKRGRRFVVLTFDDAYRDNLRHALPILQRHEAPFTLYVPTAFVDGVGQLWWQAIEDIIARQDALAFTENGDTEYVDTRTIAEKNDAFNRLYWRLRKLPEPERLALLAEFTGNYGYDLDRQCRDLIMDWQELRLFAGDPLCTIGAHTVNHYELAKLPAEQAHNEMIQSVEVIEAQFGIRPAHFSYPLGGPLSCGRREFDLARNAGFRTAVTTRPGGLYPHHLQRLTELPRVSLNGHFQQRRYVEVFASGGLFTQLGRAMG
ncbi:polysaccharide deacetylase family protein [Devosia sp. YIM 151766]|uniref:polysaccharide deacetylase family protein n=1 Tax=Devosia sp. YIM 151766 TaxID=3017325 RepID=UPI00255CE2AA|nr:polysaccharide deacetylase family protein [Devosia sp. YIM 151766]WIY54036.1 polysaccharide deacetylase family protein [Devosia sp. YIM 151766]